MPRCSVIVTLTVACTLGATARLANAQILGVQGVYVPATAGRLASLGVGADIGFMTAHGPLDIWGAIGGEFERQRDNGPGRGRVSADLRFLPARLQSSLVPFVGGSISVNRSGGARPEWVGTRTGLDALAGLLYLNNDRSSIALSLQERFGYVVGQPHALGTELGLRFRWP